MPNYYPPATGSGGAAGASSVDSAAITDGSIVNADINAAAAIALSKLASDPLARANHTGTQLLATISDAGTLAGLSAVASAQITDGTIVNSDVNAAAAIAYSKLALTGSIVTGDITDGTILGGDLSSTIAIPSAATATTQSATDGSTKLATTAYTDTADALKANLAGPTFTGTPTLPTGTIATTQSANDNSTKLATTAYGDAINAAIPGYQFAVGCYSAIPLGSSSNNAGVTNANDARCTRVVMAKSGTISSMTCGIITTSGNIKLFILDTGQANGTHTVRTCLAISGSVAMTGNFTWQTDWNPALAVTKGDVLDFGLTIDNTTARFAAAANTMPPNSMPTAYLTPNGAGTAVQKVEFNILAANVPAAVNGTVTDANCIGATAMAQFIWRIT